MLILRMFFILAALMLVVSGGMYLLTHNPRYLKLARRTLLFTGLFAVTLLLLMLLERYVLVGWRVLL